MTGFVTSGGDTSGLPFQPVEAHTDTLVAMSDETRPPGSVQVKILTVSDGVIEGTREDRSGAVLADRVEAEDWTLVARTACADGVNEVANALKDLASGFHGLIITTGGTGFGPRDLTPEGTSAVIDREAPGLAEAMRLTNPLGRLSRGIAGTISTTLIVNTPGSSAGCIECLEAVVDVVPHAVRLLNDNTDPHPSAG